MYSLETLGDLILRLQVVLVEQGGEGKMRTLVVTEVQVKELSFNRTFGFIRVKVKPRIDKTSNLILALGHDELCAFALQLTEAVGGTKLFCKVKKWRKRAKAAEKKAKRLEKLLQSERRRLFELGETG